MTDDKRFLDRWADRKARARRGEPADEETAEAPAQDAAPLPEAKRPLSEEEVARLPDPETLDADADFSVFMRAGVPAALKQRALRKLWRTKPVFAIIDGLDDYCEDYTDAAMAVKGGVKSAYQAGRGYLKQIAEKAPDEVPAGALESGGDEAAAADRPSAARDTEPEAAEARQGDAAGSGAASAHNEEEHDTVDEGSVHDAEKT